VLTVEHHQKLLEPVVSEVGRLFYDALSPVDALYC
jgi:hypothetical protein